MIELSTGIIFLMSSLYGSGYIADNIFDSNQQASVNEQNSSSVLIQSKEIENYIRQNYSDTPILVEIARCESTLRQYGKDGDIIRGKVNRNDIGVMQINITYHGENAEKLGYDIYTTEGNIAFGKYLYDKHGSQPWSSSAKCWAKASIELAKK